MKTTTHNAPAPIMTAAGAPMPPFDPKYGSQLEDEYLLEQIKAADSKAFEKLYNKYSRKIYSLVKHMLHSEEEAQELLQDVFIQLWDKAWQFDSSRGNFSTWLMTVAHHKAINVLRSRRSKKAALEVHQDLSEVRELIPETTVELYTPLDEQVELDSRDHVIRLLSNLEENKRELMLMAYYKGYSQRDIAKALKIPLGTVKTRMRQAMMQLRELLQAYPNYKCLAELI